MKNLLKFLCMAAVVMLAACTTSQTGDTTTTAINVSSIDVKLSPAAQAKLPKNFGNKLKRSLRAYARAHGRTIRGKKRNYRLMVTVTRVNFENPLTGVIDNNRIYASSRLVNASNGKTLRQFQTTYVDPVSAIASGVSGAVVAAITPKTKVEPRLYNGLAEAVMNGAYLQKTTPTAVRRNVSGKKTR